MGTGAISKLAPSIIPSLYFTFITSVIIINFIIITFDIISSSLSSPGTLPYIQSNAST
jgi:hypothetical protein